MVNVSTEQQLVRQKLAAFEELQPEFEECFQFIADVHGQKRFSSFPVAASVRYLHALWICECKDRLLSIYKNIERYNGHYCLKLLREWQEQQDNTSVIAFLHRKLDTLPFADITRQIQAAGQMHENDMAQRLMHGRLILLNRGINLMAALEGIFSMSEESLLKEVRAACEQYRHLPAAIGRQMEELSTPLYHHVPNQALAQCNMVVMNKMGMHTLLKPADLPGQRAWRIVPPGEPLRPFADHVVDGYQELLTPWHNNLKADRFVNRPERSEEGSEKSMLSVEGQ